MKKKIKKIMFTLIVFFGIVLVVSGIIVSQYCFPLTGLILFGVGLIVLVSCFAYAENKFVDSLYENKETEKNDD